ncbi:MAG: glycosyltransferase family 39 protein [Planctomycetes bacterium]|nr:glycosyltransferase family 39 protein [Planctomycetota bacterium]
MQPQDPAPRSAAVFVLATTVLALALRLPLLGRPLWFDEACMSSQRIGTFEQWLATLYVDIHPPLFVSFMHFWGRVFGDGELALRLPALVAGVAAIPLTHWVGRRLVGPVAAGWATVLLALSPVHVWYSAEARLYTPMVLQTLLLVGTFDRLLDQDQRPRRGLLPLHVANVFAMCFLHYYLAAFVLAFAGLAPVLARGFRPPVRAIVGWHGAALVALGLFVLGKRMLGKFETSQDYLVALDLPRLATFLFDWCWTGHTLSPAGNPFATTVAAVHQGLGALLCGIGTIAIIARRSVWPRGWLALVGLLLLPGFLLATAMYGLDRTFLERSAIPTLPFVFLLAGAGLAFLRGLARMVVGGATLALAVAALVGLAQLHATHWTVYKPNSDWRAAAAWLGKEIDAGGAGRMVFTSTPNPRPLSYYDPRIQDVKNLALPTDPKQLGDSVRKRLGTWLGDFAERTFTTFAAHNRALLEGAALRVHRAVSDPARLSPSPAANDGICYLVQDEWHPHRSVDSSVWDLLDNPKVEVLATGRFPGIQVHKVRIKP